MYLYIYIYVHLHCCIILYLHVYTCIYTNTYLYTCVNIHCSVILYHQATLLHIFHPDVCNQPTWGGRNPPFYQKRCKFYQQRQMLCHNSVVYLQLTCLRHTICHFLQNFVYSKTPRIPHTSNPHFTTHRMLSNPSLRHKTYYLRQKQSALSCFKSSDLRFHRICNPPPPLLQRLL